MKPHAIELTKSDFKYHTEQRDGICSACYMWAFKDIPPDQEHGPCAVCKKNAVCGMRVAVIYKLIEVV